jgi:hypothetical protein
MTRHAFEWGESGAWGASRHETGHACARGTTYAMASRASLPLLQQGHACVLLQC